MANVKRYQEHFQIAFQVAEAEVELRRIRRARQDDIGNMDYVSAITVMKRYEQRVRVRRTKAININRAREQQGAARVSVPLKD